MNIVRVFSAANNSRNRALKYIFTFKTKYQRRILIWQTSSSPVFFQFQTRSSTDDLHSLHCLKTRPPVFLLLSSTRNFKERLKKTNSTELCSFCLTPIYRLQPRSVWSAYVPTRVMLNLASFVVFIFYTLFQSITSGLMG